MELTNLLNSIPEMKKEDLLDKKLTLDEMVKLHPSLTLDNTLTYFVYLDRRKDLSLEERNLCFKIIAKLKKNHINLHESMIQKHNMKEYSSFYETSVKKID
jgi:hypothetical protein